MAEEAKPAEEPAKEEPVAPPTPAPAVEDKVAAAKEQADRLEAANLKHEELVKRQEALEVHRQLGGTAEAGQETPTPKEETATEYRNRIMKGELKDGEG